MFVYEQPYAHEIKGLHGAIRFRTKNLLEISIILMSKTYFSLFGEYRHFVWEGGATYCYCSSYDLTCARRCLCKRVNKYGLKKKSYSDGKSLLLLHIIVIIFYEKL